MVQADAQAGQLHPVFQEADLLQSRIGKLGTRLSEIYEQVTLAELGVDALEAHLTEVGKAIEERRTSPALGPHASPPGAQPDRPYWRKVDP